MPDDAISKQDLEQLRVVTWTDQRAQDTWALDDNFVKQFLEFVRGQGRKYFQFSTAINLYWRENVSRPVSRRELASALGMSLDGTKSLITNIRQRAKSFSQYLTENKNAEVTESPALEKTPPAKYPPPPRTIGATRPGSHGRNDILEFVDGDKETIEFVKEYGRLAVLSVLSFFDVTISPKLIALQNQCDDLRANGAPNEQIDKLISEARALQNSVAKDDPLAGRPMFQDFLGRVPNYHEDRRGRPRKLPITNEPAPKRKRGRPRKNQTVVSLEMAGNRLVKNESETIPLESLCIPNEPTLAQPSLN
jgi:hypothetical protein